MTSNLTRRAALMLLPVGGLAMACSSSSGNASTALPTDSQFLDIVKQEMPGLKLTPRLAGRRIVRSPGYTLLAPNQREGPEGVVGEFLELSEEFGLKPVTLYFTANFRDSWKANVPGCSPGACRKLLPSLNFEMISGEEERRFAGPQSGVRVRKTVIAQAKLNDIEYQATVSVIFDFRHRVQSHVVRIERKAVNNREARWARRNRGRRTHPISVFTYVNNLSLGRDFLYEGGPRIRRDNAKGL